MGSGCKAVFSAYACPYSGVSEDIKPVDIKQELPMETFGSIVGESVESEASVANNVKPKVEGGPWMVSKCKAVEDPEFSIKAESWMKTEDLVKEEMKMECILPTESKSIWQQMKRVSKDFMEEKVEDLWDSMTKLEAIDPRLYKVISSGLLRLHAQVYKLEEKLACKEKEVAQKDDAIARKSDLIATKDKLIDDLQQQIHTLQLENELLKVPVIWNSREDLENSNGSLNSQLDVPTTMPAVDVGMNSSDSEEQKLIQELLEQFMEGIHCTIIMPLTFL